MKGSSQLIYDDMILSVEGIEPSPPSAGAGKVKEVSGRNRTCCDHRISQFVEHICNKL